MAGTAIDLSGFGTGSLHRLITAAPEPDKVFPATANLLLYSYFNGTADQAKQFATTAKGYKHQLELGSLDTLTTGYPGVTSTAQAFVISPSFENLRFRKYRLIGPGSWTGDQGSYYLRSEYDLSSDGITSASSESFSPRRNSEQIWKINKAETLAANSRVIEMRLTNSNLLAWNESSSSTLVDGIFLKRGPSANDSNSYSFGLGFHPTNLSQVLFDSSNNITAFKYRGVQVEITRNSDELGTVITPTGIANNTNQDFTISSQGSSKIQLTDTRLLERLDFGFDENQHQLVVNFPFPFPIVTPGDLLINNGLNYTLVANKNVIRLGRSPIQQNNTGFNGSLFTIDRITNADVGAVIYVIVGETSPSYDILCSYPTPSGAVAQTGAPTIVDRSYSSKTVTLRANTIVKFTLVQRWFAFGTGINTSVVAWRYWYMENLDGEVANLQTTKANNNGSNLINIEDWQFNLGITTLNNPWTSWITFTSTGANTSIALVPYNNLQYRLNNTTGEVVFRGSLTIGSGFPTNNSIVNLGTMPLLFRPDSVSATRSAGVFFRLPSINTPAAIFTLGIEPRLNPVTPGRVFLFCSSGGTIPNNTTISFDSVRYFTT